MDASDNLKTSHPQKYFLKLICRSLYYIGMGDYWYEKTERTKIHKKMYIVYAVIINGYLLLSTLNQLLAHFRTDLTLKENNDLIQFSLAHPSLCTKFICLFLQKDRLKVLFEKLIEGDSYTFRSLDVEKVSVKKAIRYFVALSTGTYAAVLFSTIDGFLSSKRDGTPFQTEVSLIPTGSQLGPFWSFIRCLHVLHWWCIVTNMLLVDAISFTSLIFLGYKFRLACMYFEQLRVKTKDNCKSKSDKDCMEEYEKGLITGIKLHQDALWCARTVQSSLGIIYGVQIIETTSILVMCMIKLVATRGSFTFLLANFFYIACLLILNGVYMIAAGDITFEASPLSTEIFHSGWDLLKSRRRFRTLIVLAIACSQKPVYMTAFGVITLSHENFISVLRSSYSFFAVTY